MPQRLRVMSMKLPITGSSTASAILATVMMMVTTAMPPVEMPACSSRYSSMNVETVVSTKFWPKPAVTIATACCRVLSGRSLMAAPRGWS